MPDIRLRPGLPGNDAQLTTGDQRSLDAELYPGLPGNDVTLRPMGIGPYPAVEAAGGAVTVTVPAVMAASAAMLTPPLTVAVAGAVGTAGAEMLAPALSIVAGDVTVTALVMAVTAEMLAPTVDMESGGAEEAVSSMGGGALALQWPHRRRHIVAQTVEYRDAEEEMVILWL